MSEAITPYAGTSGWSGSATSEERAQREDSEGITARRQRQTLDFLAVRQAVGLTVKDLRDVSGWHHGQASSSLSVLHMAGAVARLTERRDRCQVYVLPEFVNGRETVPHGRRKREDKEAIYLAFEAGFRLGVEDPENWTDVTIRALFDNWYEMEKRSE
jgi:hypothetical protein